MQAAGTSLLYSEEFCELIRDHLAPGGILHHWYPGGQGRTVSAVARSIVNTFPHVKAFVSMQDWGCHFIASMDPIAELTVEEMASRIPPGGVADLMEWYEAKDPRWLLNEVVIREISLDSLLDPDESIKVTDDRPYNEYYLVRQALKGGNY